MSTPLPTEGMRVKYCCGNPLVQKLVGGFLAAFDRCVGAVDAGRILEAGCGEGFLTGRLAELKPASPAIGLDSSEEILDIARREFPQVPFLRGSIDALPFRDAEFDLVVACEVLEHVDEPTAALAEIRRVTARYALLSVPREPIWRVLNFMRGKYWSDWGNTPGHLNHWRPREFVELISSEFDVREVHQPFPWTMLLCEKRDASD